MLPPQVLFLRLLPSRLVIRRDWACAPAASRPGRSSERAAGRVRQRSDRARIAFRLASPTGSSAGCCVSQTARRGPDACCPSALGTVPRDGARRRRHPCDPYRSPHPPVRLLARPGPTWASYSAALWASLFIHNAFGALADDQRDRDGYSSARSATRSAAGGIGGVEAAIGSFLAFGVPTAGDSVLGGAGLTARLRSGCLRSAGAIRIAYSRLRRIVAHLREQRARIQQVSIGTRRVCPRGHFVAATAGWTADVAVLSRGISPTIAPS